MNNHENRATFTRGLVESVALSLINKCMEIDEYVLRVSKYTQLKYNEQPEQITVLQIAFRNISLISVLMWFRRKIKLDARIYKKFRKCSFKLCYIF